MLMFPTNKFAWSYLFEAKIFVYNVLDFPLGKYYKNINDKGGVVKLNPSKNPK